MKKFFLKAALLLALPLMTFSFTSCSDDDNKGPRFESELIGNYKPVSRNYQLEGATAPRDYFIHIDKTWKNPENPPMVDLSAGMGLPAGSFQLPLASILGITHNILSNVVKGGFQELNLNNDGSLGAKYKDIIFQDANKDGQISMDEIIATLLSDDKMEFDPTVKVFPSAETDKLMPKNAIGYYTKDNKFFFTISKAFLKATGEAMEEPMDIVGMMQMFIGQFKLDVVETNDFFAIPLKYTVKGNMVKISVDRPMIMPFKPLLLAVGDMLPPLVMGAKLNQILEPLLNETATLEISLELEKLAI